MRSGSQSASWRIAGFPSVDAYELLLSGAENLPLVRLPVNDLGIRSRHVEYCK